MGEQQHPVRTMTITCTGPMEEAVWVSLCAAVRDTLDTRFRPGSDSEGAGGFRAEVSLQQKVVETASNGPSLWLSASDTGTLVDRLRYVTPVEAFEHPSGVAVTARAAADRLERLQHEFDQLVFRMTFAVFLLRRALGRDSGWESSASDVVTSWHAFAATRWKADVPA